ncbi:hypothetical protein TWF173_010691 [Orbilia oligospora]|nr:hypothetical protein TWF173_010691 [Orbilia oligospora]
MISTSEPKRSICSCSTCKSTYIPPITYSSHQTNHLQRPAEYIIVKMGGHVDYDPALLKWNEMHRNRTKFFRLNSRAAKLTFWMVVAIPAATLGLSYWSEGRYELKGKRRGDIIKEF